MGTNIERLEHAQPKFRREYLLGCSAIRALSAIFLLVIWFGHIVCANLTTIPPHGLCGLCAYALVEHVTVELLLKFARCNFGRRFGRYLTRARNGYPRERCARMSALTFNNSESVVVP
jgi:hypothetical protein